MKDQTVDLVIAELLAARLCHELVNPVGAISNGVEILQEEPDFAEDAARLIGQSAGEAVRRLQFYRVAYGASDVGEEAARRVTLGLLNDGKLTCHWPEKVPDLPPGWPKLVANLLLLAAETLPRGGRVELLRGEGAILASVTAISAEESANFAEKLVEVMAGIAERENLTSRTVHTAFTLALARRLGLDVKAAHDQSRRLTLSLIARG
jgi:histidine phosphotransferase ChpT